MPYRKLMKNSPFAAMKELNSRGQTIAEYGVLVRTAKTYAFKPLQL
jgi:hypothetical protein